MKAIRTQLDTDVDQARLNMWVLATAVLANWMIGRPEDDFWEMDGGLQRMWATIERENRQRDEWIRRFRYSNGEYRDMRIGVVDPLNEGDPRMRDLVRAHAELMDYEPAYE